MTTTKREGWILDAPGKFELMTALFVKGTRVEFTVRLDGVKPTRVTVQINGVTAEDGSRQNWIIDGYIIPADTEMPWDQFSGYYDTRTRKGHITVQTHW